MLRAVEDIENGMKYIKIGKKKFLVLEQIVNFDLSDVTSVQFQKYK